jgi:hypothetical protein
MDTFIVRFYRHASGFPQEVAGVVEHVGSGERSAFRGPDELLDRLLKPRKSTPSEPAAGRCTRPCAADESKPLTPHRRCT